MSTTPDLRTLLANSGGNETPPNPRLTPQTGALEAPPDVQGTGEGEGVDALAGGVNPMAQEIAKHTLIANQVNHGDARDWAENAVAGVNAALAGFGAAGKVPPGAGALYGVGAAARQAQETQAKNRQAKAELGIRQQELDLEKQRMANEQTNQNREFDLKKAENARQQAESIAKLSEHDKRMQQIDDEHKETNFRLMHEDIEFRNAEIEREEALKTVGAKPLKVAGQEAPAFDDLGQMEQYAKANSLGTNAHDNGYRTRAVYGPDHKYHLYEVPDSGPDWHDVKGVDGKTTRIFADPLGVLNYQEKVAQTRDFMSQTSLRYSEAKKALDDFKEEGTVKKARKDLDAAGGDYSKLPAGDKEALTGDAQKRYQLAFNAYQAAQNDLRKDPDFANVPINEKTGNVDTASKEYKDLTAKYHIDDANEQLGDAYDTLRQLGHGYQPHNAPPPKEGTVGHPGVGDIPAKPAKPGDKLDAANAQKYMNLAGGNKEKAIELAKKDQWDITQ